MKDGDLVHHGADPRVQDQHVQEAGGASCGFAAPSSLGGVPRAALEAQEGLSRGPPLLFIALASIQKRYVSPVCNSCLLKR